MAGADAYEFADLKNCSTRSLLEEPATSRLAIQWAMRSGLLPRTKRCSRENCDLDMEL